MASHGLQSTRSSKSTRSASIAKMKSSNPFRSFRRLNKQTHIDDVSVSSSLCSGVLRNAGGSGRSVSGGNVTRTAPASPMSNNSKNARPLAGGTEDMHTRRGSNANDASSLSSGPLTPSANGSSMEGLDLGDDAMRREARKEKVKEKLDRYKRDQRQLKQSCVALEQQLAQTTEKLKEVDSRASFKIDSLESQLRETRVGMESVAKQSTREVTDQSECIKTLGKKLIRQAHVIKRQKKAVNQYKKQLQALKEEMVMQDERGTHREAECDALKDQLENVRESKIQMQNLLQENIEEMMDLKSETEKDAKSIMELEFNLQQKEAILDRVAREVSEKSARIAELEDELERKNEECDTMTEELKASELTREKMKTDIEIKDEEIEELRCQYAGWVSSGGGGGDDSPARTTSTTSLSQAGPDRRHSSVVSTNTAPGRMGGLGRRQSSTKFWSRGVEEEDDNNDDVEDLMETFEAELEAKDATIQNLDNTVKEHDDTIQTLKSDMVKMSSTYKQDSYLKRKEIAKLKQMNAEYALKLRALEKAFKCVSATESIPISGSRHGPAKTGSMHGLGGGGGGLSGSSLHGSSMHSVPSSPTKDEKAAAVKARLGGLTPSAHYDFPSAENSLSNESQIVLESNFFDSGHDEDFEIAKGQGQGEVPEEC